MNFAIRNEARSDIGVIAELTEAAFRDAPHASGTEHFIVDALRRNDQLTVSLVAVDSESIVGHVAISPVTISSRRDLEHGRLVRPRSDFGRTHAARPWHRLGADARGARRVAPSRRQWLRAARRSGFLCALGFRHEPALVLPGVPPEYFQALSFGDPVPAGTVRYHEAFDATG